MKKIVSLILLTFCLNLFAQNEAANWYFGENAGINFNPNTGVVTALNNGQLNTREGCASISDPAGNLLFYSDGTTVWNRNHTVMQGGIGLFGDASSTQSAIIVSKPNDPDIYYIFTVDNDLDGFNFGLNYSEVDMTLDGGLGAVTTRNVNLLPFCSEKITAVLKDCVTKTLWVVAFASADGSLTRYSSYHAFEVTDTGVNPTSVVSTFNIDILDARGNLKFSPDGTKMACANMSGELGFQEGIPEKSLLLYDFDVTTGIVSNQLELRIQSDANHAYGVEFSPNNELLYVHASNDYFSQIDGNNPARHRSTLTQFNLTAPDTQASEFRLDERQLYRGSLQIGPDGRIYRALSSTYFTGQPYLGAIENPNIVGAGANYQHNAVNLGSNRSSQGLPPFDQSIFNERVDIINNNVSTINLDLCNGETYVLEAPIIAGATYIWTKNGISIPESDFDLIIDENGADGYGAGAYKVIVDTGGDCTTNVEGFAFVNFFTVPIAYQPPPLPACDDNNDGMESFNFSVQDAAVLGGQDASIFEVKYFEDAGLTNEIVGNYTNTQAQQEIFVRVENRNNPNCFDTTSFFIEVLPTPQVELEEELKYCLNFFPAQITLTAGLLAGLQSDYTYLWSTSETTYEIEVNTPGMYAVRVTAPNGCFKDRTITVAPSNIATFTTIDVVDVTPNNSITVNVTGEGDYEFALDDINGPYQDSNRFENVDPGFHTVFVRDKNGCGIVDKIVSVIGFPKFFTPNGDRIHDTWQIQGISAQFQPNARIFIHDRYGKLLKQLDPLGAGWDGTFNGQPLPSSDYWFAVTLQDGRVFKSHFTLKR